MGQIEVATPVRAMSVVHVNSRHDWLPFQAVAPPGFMLGGVDQEEARALVFTDADGERHIYVFDEAGRKRLVQALTGGIVLPTSSRNGDSAAGSS